MRSSVQSSSSSLGGFRHRVGRAFGETPTKTRKRHHRSTSSASRRPAKRGTQAAATATKTTHTAAHRKGKSSRRPSRSYQQAPSPERYKEIQQALASKGYLQGEATGEWGPDSVEALKHFQTDQSLMPDGRISSLSLIALGLGPKRLAAKSDAAPAPGTPAPPQ
jgi:hypothetical protein